MNVLVSRKIQLHYLQSIVTNRGLTKSNKYQKKHSSMIVQKFPGNYITPFVTCSIKIHVFQGRPLNCSFKVVRNVELFNRTLFCHICLFPPFCILLFQNNNKIKLDMLNYLFCNKFML